jgi:hypothetical protein
MKLKLICALVFAAILTATTVAQEVAAPSWAIVERCLLNPTVPDEGWTFNGEILMRGWGGIHAVNTTLETPYVIHWGRGVLSPDGQWILTQEVDSFTEQLTGGGPMGIYHRFYSDIVVENLTTGETIVFPWEAYISESSGPYPFGPAVPLWLGNNRFVTFYGFNGVETKVGDLQTGEITTWTDIGLDDYEYSISLDQTRAIYYATLHDLSDNQPIRDDIVATNYDLTFTVWSRDSSVFADVITDFNDNSKTLSLFDRNGNVVATPLRLENSRINLGAWSPDNNYFSLTVHTYNPHNPPEWHSYLLDMQERKIYDLCIDYANGWAWSPDGTQFATLLGEGQQPVVVVEMVEWQPYIIAYHTGAVLRWRSIE